MIQETSREAFRRSDVPGDKTRVLARLRALGRTGATDEELQKHLGKLHRQCPPRFYLVQDGLVEDSGRRRLTESGRPAIVWVAV